MDLQERKNNTMRETAESPLLCSKGCGFFGTPDNQNLCSKCYKDYVIRIEKPLNQTTSLSDDDYNNNTSENSISSVSKNSTNVKKRCQCCKKKVGLIGFGCRCGGMFCGIHRYPEEHSCNFDFKSVGRDVLVKENPICKVDKLHTRI